MKLSVVLFKQHIGRHFKKHWVIQGRKRILKTPSEELLTKNGITIYKPEDIYCEKKEFERVEVVGFKPNPIKWDETHPNWHNRTLLTYRDNNVLLEGLNQAQVLTKTIKITGLPEDYVLNPFSKELSRHVKDILLNAHLFDAEQQKLPKRKDPERPAWNFPRDYGITYKRRNKLMTSKLLHLLESNEKYDIVRERFVLNDLFFSYPFEKEDNLIQFQLTGDAVLVSSKPLPPVTLESTENKKLPDLHPIKYTVTLNEENIYTVENIYPIKKTVNINHPHTVFVHYDQTEVKNLFEEEVTEDQYYGRSLLKTFTVAASYAKQRFGENVKELPDPVTVQCVHTDGRLFHFGVLQLNTLNLEDGGICNVWYQTERLPLFEVCEYIGGKPILQAFNKNVVQHLISFYGRS
ncbi:hypothetical protein HHI36_002792 [Cryptolaemus montrouzieri]|uniref:Large ribosomal subunit protein mL37 n=1 Tax=Cryptolaemus montrouzieri TaxID=559131 RepID=A0ABD2PBL7_9CUCU